MGGAYLGDFFRDAVYLNPGHGNHYLKVEARGVRTNRKAIGSRVFVYTSSSSSDGVDENITKSRMHHHVISPGGSYGSNALEAHIGLGQAEHIDRVEVWWQATGERQVFSGAELRLDSKILVVEGVAGFKVLDEPRFTIDISKLGHRTSEEEMMASSSCH